MIVLFHPDILTKFPPEKRKDHLVCVFVVCGVWYVVCLWCLYVCFVCLCVLYVLYVCMCVVCVCGVYVCVVCVCVLCVYVSCVYVVSMCVLYVCVCMWCVWGVCLFVFVFLSNFKIVAGDPLLQLFYELQIISCEPIFVYNLSS
jgi:hypothetical protein